jgi:hypothetical protein
VVKFAGRDGRIWSFDEADRIGERGGFGEVFRGQGDDGERVAIKRVQLRRGDPGERRRREREVEIADLIAAADNVAHLLTPVDVGEDGDDLLLVLPLAADGSLRATLGGAALDDQQKLDPIADVARGLVELAELGILHRDLKPENVLRLEGRWKIADFGIARDLDSSTATYTFAGAGTMPYMAPELWIGQPPTVKTDLYALGVLAYEVLAGALPFPGPDAPRFRDQHMHTVPPAVPGAPPAVFRLVLRMLAKDPAARPQDARWVLEQLASARSRLAPTQAALQQAALVAQQRAADDEAQRAIAQTAVAAEWDRRTQAAADLDTILDAAADLIREALPDAESVRSLGMWDVYLSDTGISITSWSSTPRAKGATQPDPLVAAGEVGLWRRTSRGRSAWETPVTPMANITCELDDDGRLAWSLLRFTAITPNYQLGPLDREHGFDETTFAQERIYMLGGMHVWTFNKYMLTADIIAGLLREAIETQ